MVSPDWIAVDWGTTRLRAWAMSGTQVLDARTSDKGMGALTPDQFEPALLDLVGDWLQTRPPVIACGMVGARTGWVEADYRAVPCPPSTPPAPLGRRCGTPGWRCISCPACRRPIRPM